MTEPREPTRLMVAVAPGAAARDRLAAALAAADIASVVIVAADGRPLEAAEIAPLVAASQQSGAAALIADDARLARTVKADGVHIRVSDKAMERYAEAREILGARALVGLDAGRSRHDAMSVGEAGADYIGFGIPAFVADRATARARRRELVGWWAEIFELPCVACDVETPEEAEALAAAGADFILLRLPDLPPGEVADEIRAFSAAIQRSRTVAEDPS